MRARDKTSSLSEKEISCLRAINGSLNWLANQSCPDLATQVLFSQQSFPRPTVADAIAANQAVRRAKQHADQTIQFCHIPPECLGLMCHSDATFANAKAPKQGSWLVSRIEISTRVMTVHGRRRTGFRLPRVVGSTLSAEAPVASSMLEWTNLLVSEALDGPRFTRSLWTGLGNRLTLLVTDWKSLFDHLMSQSSPTLEDRRTSIDVVILRDSISRMKSSLRWIPTDRMLADALTRVNRSKPLICLVRA